MPSGQSLTTSVAEDLGIAIVTGKYSAEFPLPFMVSAENASERILKGLKQAKFEIAFPWPLVWPLKIARILPYRLYFWTLRRFGISRR